MSSIGAALLDSLRSVERPGDFCVGGVRQIFQPTLDVDGVGRIAFPILPVQAERLIAIAEAAPYGQGAETVVDHDVRRTFQIDPGKVRIGGRHWQETLTELVAEASRGLGIEGSVAAEFYKLLVYDVGSFFVDHRDTEKVAGMFATMVLVLPSSYQGGELIIRHLDRQVVLDPHPEEPSEIGFAAFYGDCVHEIRPVTDGCRLTLVYNLRFLDKRQPMAAPDYRAEKERVAGTLRRWAGAENEPDKLILALEHAYTPAELSFETLKGADAGAASVIAEAAAEADCDLHLALVSIEEGGSAEHDPSYRRHWRNRDEEDDEDDEAFEVIEVLDRTLMLSEWRRPDGGKSELGDFPFSEGELCPADAFEDLTPDEQHFHEATGNEGASFERTYRRAGLVLWPRARRLAVLNQAGIGSTVPYLEALVVRWEESAPELKASLWQEADVLSGHMLSTWSRDTWRSDDDSNASRMLELQARLGNVGRIAEFLAELSSAGHYARHDNEAIVRAASLLAAPRAADLLARIIKRNASDHPDGCADLLLRCVARPIGSMDALSRFGALLIESLPGDLATPTALDPWKRRKRPSAAFVVDVLTAASRIDAGLAMRAIGHILAWPGTYTPDAVLVPAALAFAKSVDSVAWPAVKRIRQASLDHLRKRIGLPLAPPQDWARANPLGCTCADCRDLGAFLVMPDRQKWHLKAIQNRRTHVELSVKNVECDLDLATERRGSPHTLIATKNQASYERRVKERRQDIETLAALDGST